IIPFALLVLYASYKVLRESRYRASGKIDWAGLLFLSSFSVFGLVAVTRAPGIGWFNPWTLSFLTISVVSFIVFIVWETREEYHCYR
ncbi:MAG: hypothetical protein F7C32_01455, partial [Desulfurococcales archaeon]|nr:hypothetical protein [Desulfurococcales archaeon]